MFGISVFKSHTIFQKYFRHSGQSCNGGSSAMEFWEDLSYNFGLTYSCNLEKKGLEGTEFAGANKVIQSNKSKIKMKDFRRNLARHCKKFGSWDAKWK